MRAMLRMMELRGLTNFGKREQEEEEERVCVWGGGDLGPFVAACLIWEFKKKGKKWPRDVLEMSELLLGSLARLFFFFHIKLEEHRNAVPTPPPPPPCR